MVSEERYMLTDKGILDTKKDTLYDEMLMIVDLLNEQEQEILRLETI